jgi:hypothetical protein
MTECFGPREDSLKSKITATCVNGHQFTRILHQRDLQTPWLIERISWPSCRFVKGRTPPVDCTALWNVAGSSTTITLKVNKDESS